MKQLTKEQYWKLFNNLPEELKDAILSMKTANDIESIAERNEINNISPLINCISQVLLGILLPNDLPSILEKDLELKKSQVHTVMQEINRFIFYPVKPLLEELYKTELTPMAKQDEITPSGKKADPSNERKTTSLPSKDVYREIIE
jgi:hypothetical protein